MHYAGVLVKYLSPNTVEKLAVIVSRIYYGDLTKYGIPWPSEGPFTMKRKYRKFPIIDLGTIDKIKSGEIQVCIHPIGSFCQLLCTRLVVIVILCETYM